MFPFQHVDGFVGARSRRLARNSAVKSPNKTGESLDLYCSVQPSLNGYNFFILALIEAYKIATRSSFDDEDNDGLRSAFGHHLDR